jgi:hypothetical protein
MLHDRTLGIALAVMRLATAAFFLVWSLEKILLPTKQQGIFETFYGGAQPEAVIVALGVAQTAIVLLFAAGLFRTLTYGALLLMHAVSTLSTAGRLIDPYEGVNHLFWAAVPVLGLLVALFLLRERESVLVLGSKKKAPLR